MTLVTEEADAKTLAHSNARRTKAAILFHCVYRSNGAFSSANRATVRQRCSLIADKMNPVIEMIRENKTYLVIWNRAFS